MSGRGILALVAATGMGLSVAACGGGSVGSTPAPPPAPTPTPTPTPSSNTSLVAPLVSESFANDAVTGQADYPNSGTATSSAGRSTLTIAYDAGTGGYSVSTGARSQSFLPTNLDAARSTGEANIFVKTNGNTTDSLSISKNSASPGTPSVPQYRYVGGGVWQRTVQGGTGISGTLDAFSYGVTTPGSALPRTGSATYAVQLRGVAAFADTVTGARGSGTLTVNFGANGLGGNGTIAALNPDGTTGEGNRPWVMVATISSNANSFLGSFGMGRPFDIAPVDNSGSIGGRFYGPAAEEVGATWLWKDSFLGTTFEGYLLGKNSALFPANTTLDKLVVDEAFSSAGIGTYFTRDNQNGLLFPTGGSTLYEQGVNGRTSEVNYSETNSAINVRIFPMLDPMVALTPGSRDGSLSTSTFDAYKYNVIQIYNTNKQITKVETVGLYKLGSANPELALSYTGLGYWNVSQPDFDRAPRYENIEEGSFAFGRLTPVSGMPKTGTANYSGIILGQSAVPLSTSGTQLPYLLSGTSSLSVDFAGLTFNGDMHVFAKDRNTGTTYDVGTMAFGSVAGSPIPIGSVDFQGSFTKQYNYIFGFFSGHFTGPTAQELYATWKTGMTDPVNGGDLGIAGVMVGKKN